MIGIFRIGPEQTYLPLPCRAVTVYSAGKSSLWSAGNSRRTPIVVRNFVRASRCSELISLYKRMEFHALEITLNNT